MAKKRLTQEQVINKLREAEETIAEGSTVAEAVRRLGVTEPTFFRWCSDYGGFRIDRARRLIVDQKVAGSSPARHPCVRLCPYRPSGTGKAGASHRHARIEGSACSLRRAFFISLIGGGSKALWVPFSRIPQK